MNENLIKKDSWVHCPVCGNKTRVKIRNNTVVQCFPLYCPKCKCETLIDIKNNEIIVIDEPDARRRAPNS